MTAGQLALFPRRRQVTGRGHFTLTGMAAAGWTSSGQFYWDLQRWCAGEDLDLTEEQVAYFTEDRPTPEGPS